MASDATQGDAPAAQNALDFPETQADDPAELAGVVRRGLPAARYDALRDVLGVTSKRLSEILGIAPSTLSRRRSGGGRFNKDESERLLRLGRLVAYATDVLDGVENVQVWFTRPAKALGGETPLAFSDTEPGAREVERLLIRLERGVYS